MELDKEELEATRNRNKLADEMFEEIEYKKEKETENLIAYVYRETILGDKFEHVLIISKLTKNIYHKDRLEGGNLGIGIDLLKAINKKVEELGWK